MGDRWFHCLQVWEGTTYLLYLGQVSLDNARWIKDIIQHELLIWESCKIAVALLTILDVLKTQGLESLDRECYICRVKAQTQYLIDFERGNSIQSSIVSLFLRQGKLIPISCPHITFWQMPLQKLTRQPCISHNHHCIQIWPEVNKSLRSYWLCEQRHWVLVWP